MWGHQGRQLWSLGGGGPAPASLLQGEGVPHLPGAPSVQLGLGRRAWGWNREDWTREQLLGVG